MDRTLVRDLEAAGVPWELDLSFPCPVRFRSALYVALGHLCERSERSIGKEWEAAEALRARVLVTLRAVNAIGKRSRFSSWFR